MLSAAVASLARTLRASASEPTLREAAELAADMLQGSRGPLSDEDAVELTTALVERTAAPMSAGVSAALVFALGTSGDPRVKPAMIELLARFLDVDDNALYQAMIALENLDEDVLRGADGSVHDVELNRARARAYLADRSA